MKAQKSTSLCKWGIRKLASQGPVSAGQHFRYEPMDPVYLSMSWGLCHLVEPQGWWFKCSISCWVLVSVLEGGGDYLGATCLCKASLPIQPSSSFLPSYSSPQYWPLPSLNFSHTTLRWGEGREKRGVYLSYLLSCLPCDKLPQNLEV